MGFYIINYGSANGNLHFNEVSNLPINRLNQFLVCNIMHKVQAKFSKMLWSIHLASIYTVLPKFLALQSCNYRPISPFQKNMESEKFVAFSNLIGLFFTLLAKARIVMKGALYIL